MSRDTRLEEEARSAPMFKSLLGPLILAVLSVLAFIALITIFWPFTVDDAFITFRYSENLASGYGPTFNALQPPIEGYTTFLWMLLMAIPHLVRLDVVTFSKALGIASAVAFILISARFTFISLPFLKGADRMVPAAFTALMLCCFSSTPIHALSGMETGFFTFLMTLFLFTLTLFTKAPSRRLSTIVPFIGLLLGLTRPEGNIAALVGLVASAVIIPPLKRAGFMRNIVLLYVIPGLVYYFWRCHYYGHPFPLPFYIKMLSGGPGRLGGLEPVIQSFTHLGVILGALIVLGLFCVRIGHLPALLSVVSFFVFYIFPHHILGFEFRFLYPATPFLLSLASMGLGLIIYWFGSRVPASAHIQRNLLAGAVLVLCLLVSAGALPTKRKVSEKLNCANGLAGAHIALGKHLGKFPHDASRPILAVADAGAAPYYSGWRTIDTFGLNDPTIATTGRRDPEYVLSQNPDVLVVLSEKPDEFEYPDDYEQALYDGALRKGMVPAKIMQFEQDYYLWLMVVPGSDVARYLGYGGS